MSINPEALCISKREKFETPTDKRERRGRRKKSKVVNDSGLVIDDCDEVPATYAGAAYIPLDGKA
jgi:hypothetical protein